MAGYTQDGKLLKMRTKLDNEEREFHGDPLLLVKFDGTEGISRLFSYDVVMLRDSGKGSDGEVRPPLDPSDLIGTHVELGASAEIPDDDTGLYFRAGMFEAIEEVKSIDAVKFWPFTIRGLYTYRAHVVPWVKMLSRDIHYRVFEGKTVVQILDDIVTDARKTFPRLLVDTSGLQGHRFPVMDYCVQYGESSLDFMFRLMARFGIWYVFAHRTGEDNVLNETMVLYGDWVQTTSAVPQPEVSITGGDPGPKAVAKLVRRFRPPQRKTIVGGFNQLNPTNPYYKDANADPDFDLLRQPESGPPSQTKWLSTMNFAEPVVSNDEAGALSTIRSDADQSGVITLSGVSRNPSFLPGHHFVIKSVGDDEGAEDLVDSAYIIDTFSFSCHDYNYENLGGWQTLDLFFDTCATVLGEDSSDGALSKVSLWLSNAVQNISQVANNPAQSQRNLNLGNLGAALDVVTPVTAFGNPLVSALCTALMAVKVEKETKDNQDQAAYANSFIALPTTIRPQHESLRLDFPLPPWSRVVARGPQTAVVIGSDEGNGVDETKQGTDIYADALGRVRVRFPWDPGPPQEGAALPPLFPVSQPTKPTKSGKNTCWVRVVEGWAGKQYGTQFLPRIGQEVLVDFLDGDPERPVITGRLYNADRTTTNLPFPDPGVRDTQLSTLADLPATAKSNLPLSGIKTWSIPTTGGDGNPLPTRFQLLRFSDKRDSEQYLIRAQHRLDITAFDKRYESIGSDRHLTVGGEMASPAANAGDYIARVFRHYHLHVGDPAYPAQSGNRITLLEQNEEIQVKKDSNQVIGGNWSTSAGGQVTIAANGIDGTIVLNATTNISLAVGESSIVITPAAIVVTSPMVLINSEGPPPAEPIPPEVDAPQEPIAADPGDTLTPPE